MGLLDSLKELISKEETPTKTPTDTPPVVPVVGRHTTRGTCSPHATRCTRGRHAT